MRRRTNTTPLETTAESAIDMYPSSGFTLDRGQ